jgi:type IV pilus assembly protein PilV
MLSEHSMTKYMHMVTDKTKQRGIALVEVLISVLLLAIGILALVTLQAVMSKNVTQTKLRGEASFLANQLIGQMWVDQANLGSYTATSTGCTSDAFDNCTNWYAAVRQILPGGTAAVTINNGTAVTIVLNWALPGEAPSQYQINALITR